ncbi:helix-turn-helix transcriptional regulator [Solirubrobacter soli]|uniref:helix-turn-helix transcriptional regulator n=1 Tax=Solirubrobacter soli TaxID=363832 RepID=UPI0004249F54|nr:LuxR C-terminal-related transcriptional regulator [Solirubrobacter soli]
MIELPFELLESKLRPPRTNGRGVRRTALVEQLNRASHVPIVMLCAGPGYGKTTALAQWAQSQGERPFAWVTVDQHDNDPVVLLTYLAVAIDRVAPIDRGVFEALASPGTSVEATVVPRLGAELAGLDRTIVLGLDDVQAIRNPRCIDAIVALAGHVGEGSQLALTTRDGSALPMGLLRARGLSLELGPDTLRMDVSEARDLLRASGLELSETDVDELVRRTEGWPAGLYLAALSSGTGVAPGEIGSLTGNHPFIADFLRSEFFAQLPPHELRFLTATSMLEQLSGPLCDAVLASSGSADILDSLAHSNRFVVSLDREREWYRCHPLVRDLLAAELARSRPELVSPMLRRASDWCAANRHEIDAIRYAQNDGDPDRVAALMERWTMPVFQSGRTATVETWFDWLDANGGVGGYPSVAVIGAMFHGVMGEPTASERCAELAARGTYEGTLPDGSASIESWRAMLRAFRGCDGITGMHADAELAVATLAPASVWHPVAMVLLGWATLLSGAPVEADDVFADVVDEAADLGAPDMIAIALAERALIAIGREEWVRADELAERAITSARHSHRENAALNAVVYAVAGRTALHRGRTSHAYDLLANAQRRLPQLTYALPVPAVQTRLELAHAYLTLADQAGARTMLREIDAILRRRPDLGNLPAQAAEIETTVSTAGLSAPGSSTLTAAELHVLPLLTTHLTFPEIGARIHLSRHTVKSHSVSIYRKLGVTSRTAAIEKARDIGLL